MQFNPDSGIVLILLDSVTIFEDDHLSAEEILEVGSVGNFDVLMRLVLLCPSFEFFKFTPGKILLD